MPRFKRALIGLVPLALVGAALVYSLTHDNDALPPGFATANGRIEAQRVDVATKHAGRLAEILVAEGDLVAEAQMLARLDDAQLRAQLREAEAGVALARQQMAESRAVLAQRESSLAFAEKELARALELGDRGFSPEEATDLRRTERDAASAAVDAARAGIAAAEARIAAARATVDRLRADLDDYALTAPRAGRVQYRLAEPGEVLAAGARVVTLLDLTDVQMTVYLPTGAAGPLAYGAEARLVLDAAPDYVIPAEVSFIAGEAQFTPKYVETADERESLMFRVKLRIPAAVLTDYQHLVKTGLPGVAHIRIDPAAAWPERLAVNLPDVR
ncbi:HlyD family secretion protein [Rhodovulum adriaticum]|uniref:HlyD family secretion protein n=1 Tax=Rhodovulum adriaticum TaxID=35804 RepID=A0A4R2NYI1_RHOAD|nr:HlyD family efflux transporter periplasmic adaptor subunit [Rhodovulum adriaticum]MBK1636430.1 efflux transporter periplasmic adaptor subunit [Rhodovulum adriaticum]TCP26485.1 HlyD family secretion protein [Rhodovulum adriaticum]